MLFGSQQKLNLNKKKQFFLFRLFFWQIGESVCINDSTKARDLKVEIQTKGVRNG